MQDSYLAKSEKNIRSFISVNGKTVFRISTRELHIPRLFLSLCLESSSLETILLQEDQFSIGLMQPNIVFDSCCRLHLLGEDLIFFAVIIRLS